MKKLTKLGARRLLRLATILDKADALHKKRREPGYSQYIDQHSCGTPACAGGHWNASIGLSPNDSSSDETFYLNATFALCGFEEWDSLFGTSGCDGAKTAKQAAKYIRSFVKRKGVA